MKTVKVGVVGVGRMGQNHCRIYSNLRDVRLVGVCDQNPENGRLVARKMDVPFFREVESLLENVDAISIATPTPSHYDLVIRSLNSGVHVLVEKPITETLEQAIKLTQAAEATNLIVQVGHIERFNPTYIELRKVVETMEVLAINFRRLSPSQGSNTDVDVVMDLMTHDIDLVLDLMGQAPTSMKAYGLSSYSGMIDHAMAFLTFDHGPLVSLTASRVTEQKIRSIDVTTKQAFVEADLLNKTIAVNRRSVGEYLNHNHSGVKYRQESIVERILVPAIEPLRLELQHFVEAVAEDCPPQVTAKDGTKALELVKAVQEEIMTQLIHIHTQTETIPT